MKMEPEKIEALWRALQGPLSKSSVIPRSIEDIQEVLNESMAETIVYEDARSMEEILKMFETLGIFRATMEGLRSA
ncbi:hypothetical protein [Agrobacterium rosae]|uniref:hypothetical protein n=1 Tax=Agrobacterium rosae TaxID=1972867 RepID=UPI00122F7843|nr:hypothetical protein [Agrobacterium rosae]